MEVLDEGDRLLMVYNLGEQIKKEKCVNLSIVFYTLTKSKTIHSENYTERVIRYG